MAVDRKKVKDDSGTIDLCMTFSTEDYKLLQEETGIVYGKACIDTIAGYDEQGNPYSRYTYTETDEKDESEDETTEAEQKAEAFDYLTGRNDGNE